MKEKDGQALQTRKDENIEDAHSQAESKNENSTGQRFIPPLQALKSQEETPVTKGFLSFISLFICQLEKHKCATTKVKYLTNSESYKSPTENIYIACVNDIIFLYS